MNEELEKHINNLKEYCKIDRKYMDYEGDFGEFCKGHIEDIEAVINELEAIKDWKEQMADDFENRDRWE